MRRLKGVLGVIERDSVESRPPSANTGYGVCCVSTQEQGLQTWLGSQL